MSLDLFALQFAQASIVCVAAGLILLALCETAARRWPAFTSSRAPWLMAEALCLMALLLAPLLSMLPQQTRLNVAPVIVLAEPAAGDSTAVTAVAPPAGERVFATAAASTARAPVEWPLLAARAWCALYLAGVLLGAVRLLRGQRALRRLLVMAVRDDGPAGAEYGGVPVYRIDLPLSPMLLGVYRPVLLLPRRFDDLDDAQRALVIAHEHTHLVRRDPLWRAMAALVHALLWFNPAMRRLQARLHWAQEAGCDRDVLASRGAAERRVYAGVLVDQFRHQYQAIGGALAFGGGEAPADARSLAERVRLIRDGQGASAGSLARLGLAICAAGSVAAFLVLQPAYAWRTPASLVQTDVPALASLRWQAPLAQLHVNSAFGTVSQLHPQPHRGLDLKARRGTPVMAAADGVVESSGDLDAGGAKYGKTVWIAHADGHRSLYAHLDARLVSAGEAVRAGQVIGRSGATGKVSGPHLHFEVRRGEQAVDPAGLIEAAAPHSAQLAAATASLH